MFTNQLRQIKLNVTGITAMQCNALSPQLENPPISVKITSKNKKIIPKKKKKISFTNKKPQGKCGNLFQGLTRKKKITQTPRRAQN